MSAPIDTDMEFCKFCGEEYSPFRSQSPKGTCSKECAHALIMHGQADVSSACLWCPRRGDLNAMYTHTLCVHCHRTRYRRVKDSCTKCGAPTISKGRCQYCTNLNKEMTEKERLILLVDKSTRRASFRRAYRAPGQPSRGLPVYFLERRTFEQAATYNLVTFCGAYACCKIDDYSIVLDPYLLEWVYHCRGRQKDFSTWLNKLDKVQRTLSLGPEFKKQEWGHNERTLERFCRDMKRCGVRYTCRRGVAGRTLSHDDLEVVEIVLQTAIRNFEQGAYWI